HGEPPGDTEPAEADDPILAEWDELATRCGASVFLRPGWVAAWWRAFGRGRLELITTRRAGRLFGLLPLAHRGGRWSSPTNWHTPLFGVLADDVAAAAELADRLLESRPREVSLSFVDPGE